jgi:hypothetical protein
MRHGILGFMFISLGRGFHKVDSHEPGSDATGPKAGDGVLDAKTGAYKAAAGKVLGVWEAGIWSYRYLAEHFLDPNDPSKGINGYQRYWDDLAQSPSSAGDDFPRVHRLRCWSYRIPERYETLPAMLNLLAMVIAPVSMRAFVCLSVGLCLLLPDIGAIAAPTTGKQKVLGIRVNFKDVKSTVSAATMEQKLKAAKSYFGMFSYGKLDLQVTAAPLITLKNNRNSYNASKLATEAENKAKALGYNVGSFAFVGFYYNHGSITPHATVGGKRFWAGTGGATIHEMGHNIGFGHQYRWDSTNSNPIGAGTLEKDPWTFMATGSIDPEPPEKWRCKWITQRHQVNSNGSYTFRLWTFDQKNIDAAHQKRTVRVKRATATKKYFWLGFRSRLHDNQAGAGKNTHLRQGIVFYWERSNASPVLLDMHPSGGGLDDHALQPGETYSDNAGNVHITHLGRGGTQPNEYVDVRINRGTFANNKAPAPTWDAPSTWKKDVPLTITVQGNDPDGDEVAVRWKFSDRNLIENTSATAMTRKWTKTGKVTLTAIVSDMKGKTVTLKKTITILNAFLVYDWTGESSDAWGAVDNWSPTGSPNERSERARWSEAFNTAVFPQFSASKSVRGLILNGGLTSDVIVNLLTEDTALNIYDEGIQMALAKHNLAIGGQGEVVLYSDQTWKTNGKAELSVMTDIRLNGYHLDVMAAGDVSLGNRVLGTGGLTMNGKGVLFLPGKNNIQGPVTVAQGEVRVTGQMSGSGNMVVQQGGLTGSGTVSKHLNVFEDGSIAPGPGVATLSLIGGLSLAGSLHVDIDRNAEPSSDQLVWAGDATFAKSAMILVNNTGPPLESGDTFQVFNEPTPSASMVTISPEPEPGVVWENRLGEDGTIAYLDLDECLGEGGGHNCDINALCTNSLGSFSCTCLDGYSGDGLVCIDDDECSLETNNCSQAATCINTPGSFNCACNAGYAGNGVVCIDDDECSLGTNNCDSNALCSNLPGSFACTCIKGYQGDGIHCTDVDECLLSLDDCDANAACTNSVGSFSCACNAGYTGDGFQCEDVDECSLNLDNCDTHATCTNTSGDFTCECLPGYQGDGTGCEDVDECMNHTNNCAVDATCTNIEGTFSCACNSGFYGDGVACCQDGDIDSVCDNDDNCPEHPNTEQLDSDKDGLGNACECPEGIVCNDDNPCTDDGCADATGCVHTPNSLPCDDADICTETTCQEGSCIVVQEIDGCCHRDADCDVPLMKCNTAENLCSGVSCADCASDADCGVENNSCLTLTSGSVCTVGCDEDATICPAGTECLNNARTLERALCLPLEGDCACVPTDAFRCDKGALYALDSCGIPGGVLDDCSKRGCTATGCCSVGEIEVDGICATAPDPSLGLDPDDHDPANLQDMPQRLNGGEATGCQSSSPRHSALPWLLLSLSTVLIWRQRRRFIRIGKRY